MCWRAAGTAGAHPRAEKFRLLLSGERGCSPSQGLLLLAPSPPQPPSAPGAAAGSRLRGQPCCGVPLGPSCSSSLLALSNNPLPFLDRASKWLTRRGSVTERPQRPTAPTRRPRPALGRTGTHWDAAVRGWTEGARAAGGTIFCLCSYFCAGRTNREVVFCSLIAAHKQRAEFSRRCSTGTEREVAGRGARSAAHPSARGWAADQTLLLLQLLQISVPWSPWEQWLWVCVDFPCSFPRFRAVPPLTHGATSSSQPHVG